MDIEYAPKSPGGNFGKRVVGRGGTEREAPVLMIRFSCPKCFHIAELDAYQGVPVCPNCTGRVFLIGQSIIRDVDAPHPLDDIRAMRHTDSARSGVM